MDLELEKKIYKFLIDRKLENESRDAVTKRVLEAIKEVITEKRIMGAPDFSDEWWIDKEQAGLLELKDIYRVCYEAECNQYYDQVLDKSIPQEAIIVDYMMKHSFFQPNTSKFIIRHTLHENMYLYGRKITKVDFDGSKFILNTSIGTITYYQATDKYLQDDEYFQDILFNKRRYNGGYHCHDLAYDLTCKLKAKGVTGVVSNVDGQIVHSWVEKDDDCIDIAHNIVLKRENFYRLYKPEIWNSLTFQDIQTNQIENCVPSPFLTNIKFYSFVYHASKKYVKEHL